MRSLRARLLVIVLVIMIISLGILSGLSYYFSKQFLMSSVKETVASLGSDYAARVEDSVTQRVSYLQGISNNLAIRPTRDRQTIMTALDDALQRNPMFDTINFVYLDGTMLRFDGKVINLADRDYLQQAIRTKQVVISHPIVGRGTQKATIVVAVPIIDHGNLVGVLNGTTSLEILDEVVKKIRFKDSGYGAIVDQSGLLLAYKDSNLIGKINFFEKKVDTSQQGVTAEIDERLRDLLKKTIESGQQSQGMFTSLENITCLGVVTAVNLPGNQRWAVIISAPEAEVTDEVTRLTHLLIIITLSSISLGSLLIFLFSKKFSQPIIQLKEEAILLASGDLRQRDTAILTKDEIGQLADAFRKMGKSFREFIRNVQERSESVAAASQQLTAVSCQSAEAADQVANSVAQIANGSGQQSLAIHRVTEVVKGVTEHIQQISCGSKEITGITEETYRLTRSGRKSIEQAVFQMKKIVDDAESVRSTIDQLARGAKEIGQIINLISTIAEQTNLLALNAAIEAARAGKAGRGFAVVSEEVRKLAEESNAAAQKITVLIQKNQVDMQQAIAVTAANSDGAKIGIEIINSAGNEFMNIYSSIEELSSQIHEIASAINQISSGSKQLVASMKDVEEISQKNIDETETVSAATEEQSATMGEISSASQALAQTSIELNEAISKFRYK